MSARRPWIRVVVDPVNHTALVSGERVRDLVVECGGRPLWLPRRRAWSTQARTAADVLALAEVRGYAVAYEQVGGGTP